MIRRLYVIDRYIRNSNLELCVYEQNTVMIRVPLWPEYRYDQSTIYDQSTVMISKVPLWTRVPLWSAKYRYDQSTAMTRVLYERLVYNIIRKSVCNIHQLTGSFLYKTAFTVLIYRSKHCSSCVYACVPKLWALAYQSLLFANLVSKKKKFFQTVTVLFFLLFWLPTTY